MLHSEGKVLDDPNPEIDPMGFQFTAQVPGAENRTVFLFVRFLEGSYALGFLPE